MCAICGIVDINRDKLIDQSRLSAMRDVMQHRGPDDAGIWLEPGAGLGHRRLSILDLSPAGHQPMISDDGNYVLTYNGEIYNFLDLRAELQGDGLRFRSNTDTEVLLKGFQRWGLEKLLQKLVGIFAFALWERRERRLVLARDHFGVKPLYWSMSGGEFLFASELKGLFRAGVERQPDLGSLDELLIFRFTAGPCPPFRGVRRLLPGHYLVWNDGHVREVRYYSLLDRLDGAPVRPSEWYQAFSESVRAQKLSDVPLGTLLSGGLDSSAVTAELARCLGAGVQTFTVSAEKGLDEAPYARLVAERWHCRSHVLRLDGDGLLGRFLQAQWYNDEPLAHGNDMHLLAVSELAQRHVKVLLSGEGADETLAGYVRYLPLQFPRSLSVLLMPLGAPVRVACAALNGRARKFSRFLALRDVQEYILFNSADVLPGDLQRMGKRPAAQFEWRRMLLSRIMKVARSPLQALMLYDLHTFLPSLLDRNDRMTMGASIECRVPFLDHRLVETALRIPEQKCFSGGRGKNPLRLAMRNLLPEQVLTRPKWGFGTPLAHYLREKEDCRRFLQGIPHSEVGDLLALPDLHSVIRGFLAGNDDFAPVVRQIFFVGIWWQALQRVEETAA